MDGGGPVDEQSDAGRVRCVRRERPEHHDSFAVDVERFTTCREDLGGVVGGEECINERSGFVDEVFAVVEDHQRLLVGEEREDLGRLVAGCEVEAEAVGDR